MFDIIAQDILMICIFDKKSSYNIHHICDMVQIGIGAYIGYVRGHHIKWM